MERQDLAHLEALEPGSSPAPYELPGEHPESPSKPTAAGVTLTCSRRDDNRNPPESMDKLELVEFATSAAKAEFVPAPTIWPRLESDA